MQSGLFDSNVINMITDTDANGQPARPADSNLFTGGMTIDSSALGSKVTVTNNYVSGTSFGGLFTHDGHGTHEFSNNYVQMTPWTPLTAQGRYFNPGFAASWCMDFVTQYNRVVPAGTFGGAYVIDRNEFHCEQPGSLGFNISNGVRGPPLPVAVAITKNDFYLSQDAAGPAWSGIFNGSGSQAYVARNSFYGQGLTGNVIGAGSNPTDNCAYVANNFEHYTSQVVEMVFGPNTNGNVVVGNGSNSDSVLFSSGDPGTNKVTGATPCAGGVGQTIQNSYGDLTDLVANMSASEPDFIEPTSDDPVP
jgi:hypothetical protein